jgi:hypothetical protein
MLDLKIHEYDVVALLIDVPEFGLTRGDLGAVMLNDVPGELLVEFSNPVGETIALLELNEEDVLKINMAPKSDLPSAELVTIS